MSDEIVSGEGFSTFEERDKIVVGFSGGVDSSVCVKILKEQGFDVTAVFIKFSKAHEAHLEQAKKVATELGVPFLVESCEELFEQSVIAPFCKEYSDGVTPSPCVMCNPLVKFKTLESVADRLGVNFIATGHYARIDEKDGIYFVQKGISEKKDQSYMLYRLPQNILARLCLPIGEFIKDDVRDIASEANLSSANTPDSQEICFIPNGDYAEFIKEKGYDSAKKGRFIGPKGEDMGEHKGILHYTVGQRKGLNISYSEPIFVKRILQNGNIELAISGDEFFCEVDVKATVKTDGGNFAQGEQYTAKVRSRGALSPCTIKSVGGEIVTVRFNEPQRAPAPGQSLVFYSGSLVMGGGVICDMR